VSIANNGPTAAAGFDVTFTPGGGAGPAQAATFPQLGAHQSVNETFTGPACSSATAPTVTVDPEYAVLDANRANNSATASCPGP
jgi:hypothetical protein